MEDAPTPDEVIIKLLEFQRKNGEEPLMELPEKISSMQDGRVKRFWILLYFFIRSSTAISDEKTMYIIEHLRQIESKEMSEEEKELYIWTEEKEELNPRILATTSIQKIRTVFTSVQKRIPHRKYPKIRELFRMLAQLEDILDTAEMLSSFPLITYRIVCYVMKYAWGKIVGIPMDRGVARVMARLGWVSKKEYISLKHNPNHPRMKVNHIFQYNTWKHVFSTLKIHSETICYVGKKKEPACERCPLNKICPSSSVNRKVHMYLNTLQEQGYFPETKEKEEEPAPEELASCTETESEDFSDIG
ncbi:endonuclease III [Nematocida sp. LUAm1]|nr:endonuclease III [Nematocida sp. LUAm1]